MNTVDIRCEGIEIPRWVESLEAFSLKVLELLDFEEWEVSVLLCDDEFIKQLNSRYRDRNESTDVLSFAIHADSGENNFSAPSSYDTIVAGDIVISLETWERQARDLEVDRGEELKRLMVHGILHLAGLDHRSDNFEREEMLKKQEHILRKLTGEIIF